LRPNKRQLAFHQHHGQLADIRKQPPRAQLERSHQAQLVHPSALANSLEKDFIEDRHGGFRHGFPKLQAQRPQGVGNRGNVNFLRATLAQLWQDVHSQMKRLDSTRSLWSICIKRTISCGLKSALEATGQPLVHFWH
jgi:hypothetical protein